MSEKKIIDPWKTDIADLPLVCFSDHSSGLIQWLIKLRTKAAWNHVMMMIITPEKKEDKLGKYCFASQGNMFSCSKLQRYMTKRHRLKFFYVKDLSIQETIALKKKISDDLKAPWYKRFYDYLGIVGQAVGIKKVNSPGNMYCSERVAATLKLILDDIPEHPSPQDLDNVLEKHERAGVYGYWLGD
jgi:hypothetical protein